jgi:hypothetical protein
LLDAAATIGEAGRGIRHQAVRPLKWRRSALLRRNGTDAASLASTLPDPAPRVEQYSGKKMKVSPRIGKRDGRPQHAASHPLE